MKATELSSFCMQISFLLEAGISIDSGLSILSEDAPSKEEQNMLITMSENVEFGMSFSEAMKITGNFPEYMIQMVEIGQETGNLEIITKSLAEYYEKEENMAQTIKNALTYPFIMICMLIVVLFVLLTKVMPIFEGVYKQLGAQLSPMTKGAIQIGSIVSGTALVVFAITAIVVAIISISANRGKKILWTEKLVGIIKEKSYIAATLTKRRISAIMAISIKSGLEIERGMEMAIGLIPQKSIREKFKVCKADMELGKPIYEAMKSTGTFTNLDLQMIKVGSRSGKSDIVFDELAKKYENEVDSKIDNAISRFEPTMVVILAVVVGLILLSVMMPLVGIMASIG